MEINPHRLLARAVAVPDSFTCPRCHATSYHPEDIANQYCGVCHVWVEDLRNELVSELDLTLIEPRNRPTRRDCYTCAALAILQSGNPEAVLMHGLVRDSSTGLWMRHAWVEVPAKGIFSDGITRPVTAVVDFTQVDPLARVVPADHYYAQARVCVDPAPRRYTVGETVVTALLVGHDGPWPGDPHTPAR